MISIDTYYSQGSKCRNLSNMDPTLDVILPREIRRLEAAVVNRIAAGEVVQVRDENLVRDATFYLKLVFVL